MSKFFSSFGKKVLLPSSKPARLLVWKKMKDSDDKASVSLGFLREMKELCDTRDLSHPLECARAVLHAPTTLRAPLSYLSSLERVQHLISLALIYSSKINNPPGISLAPAFC
jgi:hypothetical protein